MICLLKYTSVEEFQDIRSYYDGYERPTRYTLSPKVLDHSIYERWIDDKDIKIFYQTLTPGRYHPSRRDFWDSPHLYNDDKEDIVLDFHLDNNTGIHNPQPREVSCIKVDKKEYVIVDIIYPMKSKVSIDNINVSSNFNELSNVIEKLDKTLDRIIDINENSSSKSP